MEDFDGFPTCQSTPFQNFIHKLIINFQITSTNCFEYTKKATRTRLPPVMKFKLPANSHYTAVCVAILSQNIVRKSHTSVLAIFQLSIFSIETFICMNRVFFLRERVCAVVHVELR